MYYKQFGTLENPGDLKFEGMSACVMQEGDATFTIMKDDNNFIDWMKHYEIIPKFATEGWVEGLMHSHHTMGVRPSTEDDDEMFRSSKLHKSYLSVICNNYGEYSARFCYRDTIEVKKGLPKKYPNMHPDMKEEVITEEVLFMYEVDVIGQEPPEEIWKTQFDYARKVGREKDRKGNPIKAKGGYVKKGSEDEWDLSELEQEAFDDIPTKRKVPVLNIPKINKGKAVSELIVGDVDFSDQLYKAAEYWILQTVSGKYTLIEDIFKEYFAGYNDSTVVNLAQWYIMLQKTIKHVYGISYPTEEEVQELFELIYVEIDDLNEPWMDKIEQFKKHYVYKQTAR